MAEFVRIPRTILALGETTSAVDVVVSPNERLSLLLEVEERVAPSQARLLVFDGSGLRIGEVRIDGTSAKRTIVEKIDTKVTIQVECYSGECAATVTEVTGVEGYVEGDTNVDSIITGYGPGTHLDAFARLRVSEPFTIFDSKHLYDKTPLLWDEEINSVVGATSVHSTDDAAVTMTVGGNGDHVIRQTFQRFHYQPGKSQLVLMTGRLSSAADTISRVGAFDGDTTNHEDPHNGVFFESDGGNVSLCVAKNGTVRRIARTEWDDPGDGTGASGLVINFAQLQIFAIDFQWLGAGQVRFGVSVGGQVIPLHAVDHANSPSFTQVYMQTANLPLRYSIESTGGSSNMLAICASVISEGGVDPAAITTSADTRGVELLNLVATSLHPLLAVRLNPDQMDTEAVIEGISIVATSNANIYWALLHNPTVTTWNPATAMWVDVENSALQKFVFPDVSTVVSAGNENLVMQSGHFSNQSRAANVTRRGLLRPGVAIDGTLDYWVLCVMAISGAGHDVAGGLLFRELA